MRARRIVLISEGLTTHGGPTPAWSRKTYHTFSRARAMVGTKDGSVLSPTIELYFDTNGHWELRQLPPPITGEGEMIVLHRGKVEVRD